MAGSFSWRSIQLTVDGTGHSISLRITKMEGIPVQLVPEGTPGASVVAVRRVNELSFYSLGRDDLADHVGLSGPKTTAVIRYLDLQNNQECCKEIIIGESRFKRYSPKAINAIKKALEVRKIDEIWAEYGTKKQRD